MSKSKGKITEKFTPAQIIEYKSLILGILDAGGAKTVSAAARLVEVSPTKVRDWMKSDEIFRSQVKQARNVLVDKLIEELLDDYDAKMPSVVAKIFIIKGLAPEFRDSYRTVEFKDERGVKILEELRRLGKQHTEKVSKLDELPPAPQPENPLLDTALRLYGGQQTETGNRVEQNSN